jgi:5-methylcytosine-specific restriction endonuclease McrA
MPRLGAQYKGDRCKLSTFHPVTLGIHPVSQTPAGSSSRWRKRRALILKMHDYCCVYCGDEANTVDHVIPITKGGTDHPLNLVACCSRCNSAFGDKTKHIEFKIGDVNHFHIVRRG